MSADPIKTRGAGKVQVFDAVLEPPAEQERLNRVLHRKVMHGPTSGPADGAPAGNTSQTRLRLLLQQLAQIAPMIRRDLPGWYPKQLLPVLQITLERITTANATWTDLNLSANRLAKVLRDRPETAEIARTLELAPLGTNDRTMRSEAEHGETERLPAWIQNDHCVLVRKIIEELPSGEGPPA